MNSERLWQNKRMSFLKEVKEARSNEEVLRLYQRLLENMKASAMTALPHDEFLRQSVALLFKEAAGSAEILLARGQPYVVTAHVPARGRKPLLSATSFAAKPIALNAVLLAGLAVSLSAFPQGWLSALFFAAALALFAFSQRRKRPGEKAVEAKADLRTDYLDAFIQRQAIELDAHIQDLRALICDKEDVPAADAPDENALSLCQYAWGAANGGYPPQAACAAAEKLLKQNGLQWLDYQPGHRAYFDILPTRKAARTVLPAIRRQEDGGLVRKGQYIEPEGGAGA